MPAEITLDNPIYRDLLLRSVEKFHILVKKCKHISVSFKQTKKVLPHGMLYLYAEMENLISIYPELRFSCVLSRHDKVNHVLFQIGMLKLCRHSFTETKKYNDVIYWRKCSGKQVISEQFDTIIDPNKILTNISDKSDIYGGCVEATKNAHMHASIPAPYSFTQLPHSFIHSLNKY